MTLDQMTLGLFGPWALGFTAGGVFLGSLSVVTGKYVKQFSCVNIFLKLHKHILCFCTSHDEEFLLTHKNFKKWQKQTHPKNYSSNKRLQKMTLENDPGVIWSLWFLVVWAGSKKRNPVNILSHWTNYFFTILWNVTLLAYLLVAKNKNRFEKS